MKFQLQGYFIILLFSIGCDKNSQKSIVLNKERVEGDISKDTVFNGEIKFYDLKTNKLVSKCNYINGKLFGDRKDYYLNGNLSLHSFYEGGKLLGSSNIYNTSGILEKKEYYYYDIQVGESISYKKGEIAEYYFYSLDGSLLFWLNYDSINGKRITDLQSNYFFIKDKEYSEVVADGNRTRAKEFFIYTPNPPKYNFKYSLVTTDSTFKKINIIREFDGNKPWSEFNIENFDKPNRNLEYAIKLSIYDSIAGGDIIMYKKLK